jgi:hypothetical protein
MAEAKKSVHDIAQFIRSPQQSDDADIADSDIVKAVQTPVDDAEDTDDTSPQVGENETDDEVDYSDDPNYTPEDDLEDDDEAQGEDDEVDEEEESEDDPQDDGYLAVDDDDLIEVKIDGETVLRSIADAKKALSGEGAIEKRLKEATEARKQAQADHTQLLEQFSIAHRNLTNALSGLEDVVFQPAVAKPDPALKQQDPQKYLIQLDDYQADQERVSQGKDAIRQLIKQNQDALQKDIEDYRKQQSQQLVKKLPVISDKEKAPKVLKGMQDVAVNVYGFSPDELKVASDHRMYLMMYDLMKYHEARGKVTRKTETVKNLDGQASKRPRTLRSGATKIKSQTRRKAEQQKKVTEQARKTGKVKDVAATLMKPRG